MHRSKYLKIFITALFVCFSLFISIPSVEAQYTNLCGSGIGGSFYGCSANCSTSGQSCSGPYVGRYVCNGRHNECGGGGATPFSQQEITNGTLYMNAACGQTVQLDVWSDRFYGNLTGYMVYYGGDCTVTTPPPTQSPPPPICTSCSSYNNCQSGTPPSKFRQTPQNYSGSWRTCYNGQTCGSSSPCNCPSTGGNCYWTHYYNSAPSCSISLDRTSVTREDAPINMRLTVSDADYGDTVEITGFEVSNYCAQIRTQGGTSLSNGIVVKLGSDSPGYTTQVNNFVLNQQLAHGVFNYIGGTSLCQATVTIQITDRVGDSGDSQATRTCSASFSVTNHAPYLVSAEMIDRDPVTSLRRQTNLVDGINGSPPTVWVSSQSFDQRPAQCNASVDLNGNPITDCNPKTPIRTKSNPFELGFTVNDNNGSKDINYAGVWIQRVDIPNGAVAPVYPPVASSVRRSLAFFYSDYNDRFIGSGNHWITRADFNTNLVTGTNRLAGMRLGGGGIGNSSSPYRSSLYREWQTVGFPDCYDSSASCNSSNIPTNSRNFFNGTLADYHNYLWDVVATSNNYICYDNSMYPRISSSCDNSCAACVRRSQTNSVLQMGPNAIRFGFELQINEQMAEGRYAILLMADDKVGATLNNGPQWGSFTRRGVYCSNCGADQFIMGIDKTPPTYTTRFREGIGDEIYADVANIADNLSGYAGLYRIIYYKQDPTGQRAFLTNAAGNCQYNGQQNCYTGATPQSGFTFVGYGVRGADIVHSYVCLYDVAGNGGCRLDDMNPAFVAQDNWMKTSMGSIYSNTSALSTSAFQIQVPANPPNVDIAQTLAADLLYAPFTDQRNTVVSGAYVSAASAPGVSGGNSNRQGGTGGDYRQLSATNRLNVTGIIDNSGTRYGTGGWYARMLSLANYNCPILKARGTVTPAGLNSQCQEFTSGNLVALDQMENPSVQNKMITLNLPTGSRTRTTRDYTCSRNNIIFVASGHLEWTRQLRKTTSTGISSTCVFVVANGATLTIGDEPNNEHATNVDRFQAGIIADGNIVVELGARGSNGQFDMLQLHGFVFAARSTPRFERDLIFSINKQLPSEYLVYDPLVIDSMRPLLGTTQYSEFRCGTSSHPVCAD